MASGAKVRVGRKTNKKRVTRVGKTNGGGRGKSIVRSMKNMNVSKGPFPPRFFTMLQYAETVLLSNAGDAGPDSYVFRANSIYDPNATGAGGQPRFYDSLMGAKAGTAPYTRYKVYACLAIVKFVNTGTVPARCSIGFREDNDNAPSNLTEARMRNFYTVKNCSSSGNGNTCVIKKYMPIHTVLGVPKSGYSGETTYAANYNANPSVVIDLDIQAEPWNPTNATAFDIYAEVKLVYYVKMYYRNDVADS